MKFFFFVFCSVLMISLALAQEPLSGTVVDNTGNPLVGANVRYVSNNLMTVTSADGSFSLPSPRQADTLLISFVGYLSRPVPVGANGLRQLHVALETDPNALEEVVINTGYYRMPKERATGSFTHVGSALINRSVSTNILQRLEGVANGVQFVEPHASDASGIRVRGLSTIEADTRPLIVVDNFPYEGDINTINPNDVESITVLRDAAASSIWGARAGNGVIVINTKQGAYNQTARISINSNVTIGEKPNLFYSQNYLPSSTVMEIQKELFERGAYSEANHTYIPSYVELLVKQRDGLIGESEFNRQAAFMRRTDLRQDAMDYLYQPSLIQQHNIGATGGGDNYRYALSAGYNRNRSHVVGDNGERLNLSLQNTFRVRPGLELTGAVWYTRRRAANNGITHTDLGLFNRPTFGFSNIYDGLVDADGKAAATFSEFRQAYREQAASAGLLDWMYRPLDEQRLLDNTSGSKELRLNAGIRYRFFQDFHIDGTYQYSEAEGWSRQYHSPESYFVRDLVNQFTQSDGSTPIPHNGILEYGGPLDQATHSTRVQVNFDKQFGKDHQLAALAGSEMRQRVTEVMPPLRFYDYDLDLGIGSVDLDYQTRFPKLPRRTGRIPTTTITTGVLAPDRTIDRFLSYFGNASYTLKKRYVLSGSMRWDGSNLLGVKTNQRGTVLWSLGGSWDVSKEDFYKNDWLPYLRLRATYGSAGNIDKSQSHYPTIYLQTDDVTNLTYAALQHPGNPLLRWEQVNTVNIAAEWQIADNRVSGAVEYYDKHAKHLLGDNLMDPTTGVSTEFKINYANLRTRGWDIQLISRNLTGPLRWKTDWLLNTSANKITRFNGREATASQHFSGNPKKMNKSVDIMYALPWHGLSATDGMPVIYVDGQPTTDLTAYRDYFINFPVEEILAVGSRVPKWFGTVRNTFDWKGVQLGFLLSFKSGYVFRRNSIGSGQEYSTGSPTYHTDYFKRWQKPGDESKTDVPAWNELSTPNQKWAVYEYAEVLVTRGDYIRLQDINLSYALNPKMLSRMPFRGLRVYAYARNLGVLWRANDHGIDPDYISADFVAPKTFALGIQVDF